MTRTATATIKLHSTAQGWTGHLTFDFSDEAPTQFAEWCESQDVVNVVRRQSATVYTLLLGFDPTRDSLMSTLTTLVAAAANRLGCNIEVTDQTQEHVELSAIEQRLTNQATRTGGPGTRRFSSLPSTPGGLHARASSPPRSLRLPKP